MSEMVRIEFSRELGIAHVHTPESILESVQEAIRKVGYGDVEFKTASVATDGMIRDQRTRLAIVPIHDAVAMQNDISLFQEFLRELVPGVVVKVKEVETGFLDL